MATKSSKLLPLIVSAIAAVLLLGAVALLSIGRPAPAQNAQADAIGGAFTLTNGDGKTVTATDLHGKYLLVYFGYTFCPDVCPTTLADIAQALDKLGAKADRVQPLFITVDPARDTPAVMRHYVTAFSPRIEGLTGTPAEIADVAKKYHVYYAVHPASAGSSDYTVDHSSVLYVMGPDGGFAGIIRADQSPDGIAHDLEAIMAR